MWHRPSISSLYFEGRVENGQGKKEYQLAAGPYQLMKKHGRKEAELRRAVGQQESDPAAIQEEQSMEAVPPSTALDPKVQAPYVTESGETPRQLLVQRKKRQFAEFNISRALRSSAIDTAILHRDDEQSAQTLSELTFGLEQFDNSEYEDVPLDMRIQIVLSGRTLPARALRKTASDGYHWATCIVNGYRPKTQTFQIQWSSDGSGCTVKRLCVCFDDEDPERFVSRIVEAVKARILAYQAVQVNLYTEFMPPDDNMGLDPELIRRLVSGVLAQTKRSAKGQQSDPKALLKEVQHDFTKCMNKIVCMDRANKGNGVDATLQSLLSAITQQGTSQAKKDYEVLEGVNVRGTLQVFSFKSFLVKPEAIAIIVHVKGECSRMAQQKLFNCNISKSVTCDEFEQLQMGASATLQTIVRESWISGIRQSIKSALSEVQKGSFYLGETDSSVYEQSKLKKLLDLVNLMMQDALRLMVRDSVHAYRDQILRRVDPSLQIVSVNKTETKQIRIDYVEAGKPKLAYTTDLGKFITLPLQLLEKSVTSLQNLVRIERHVMEELFWSEDPLISLSISPDWLLSQRNEIEKALETAVSPLTEYLRSFDPMLAFLGLDLKSFMADVTAKWAESFEALDAKALISLVVEHQRKKQEVDVQVPAFITLGLFTVNCMEIRSEMEKKHEKIAKLALELLLQRLSEGCREALKAFDKIAEQLQEPTVTLEDVFKRREFINTVPALLEAIKQRAQKVFDLYNELEANHFRVSPQDFAARWRLLGGPSMVQALVKKTVQRLDAEVTALIAAQQENTMEFGEKLKQLQGEVSQLSLLHDVRQFHQIMPHISRIKEDLNKADEEATLLRSRNRLLGKEDAEELSLLTQMSKEFEPYCTLWETIERWKESQDSRQKDSLFSLDPDKIETEATECNRNINKALKFFEKQSNGAGCLKLASEIRKQIDLFLPSIPLIIALCSRGMKERHWQAIREQTGLPIEPGPSLTLNGVLALDLDSHMATLLKVGERASKEYTIEQTLAKMESAWEGVELELVPYRETGTYILKGVDDYMAILDEQTNLTQALCFSSFKGPFEQRITEWNDTLRLVSEVLDEWIKVQRNWLYLQPIFDSPDINKQLPTEGKRFGTVDKTWRSTMNAARTSRSVLKFCASQKLCDRFEEASRFLEMIQKGLSDYLETKRAVFSRFYFLSNDELLDILSQTKDPTAVQPHLKKCFEGIKAVEFSPQMAITEMISSEGERIPFSTPVVTEGRGIEFWMNDLRLQMTQGVRKQLLDAIKDYPAVARTLWVQKWPGQVVINGSQVHWTLETEALLRSKGRQGLKEYYDQIIAQLSDMVTLIRGKLSKMARVTIGALSVIDVHARDVIYLMYQQGVETTTDFDWARQMRFYWADNGRPEQGETREEGGDLFVEMVTSSQPYGYEYLGNSPRLVITPLTDKCYLTIMGALQMILGAAPAGPAGTGKTETTKDLAKALAKQCVVFNCSDGLDYLAMGKFFKGLASSGAWACFDEFNRINVEVLSVIAQQIMTLQHAVQRKQALVRFEGTDLPIDPSFAVFITMNPGYAGRSDLPDNLASLFRPVAMMVPDYTLIGEIMLFSFGFLKAKVCAEKMVATFRLCSEQLSSQDHYDYGMRAVKTTITAAGNLKRTDPEMDEELLLMRALRDVNMPKFLAHDVPLFEGIMSDLFPGVEESKSDYGQLLRSLHTTAIKFGLQPVPSFIQKCVQLYETVCVRHGLMLVGASGGGKSCNLRTLAESLTRLKIDEVRGPRFEKVQVSYMNPKSVTMGQLYGEYDPTTHEWKDGVLASVIRSCTRDTGRELKWVVFDGPVDALWIENMNTVLDDNKKLCLTSGEIMALTDEMTMAFETDDLSVASPATVSRCGMVYMEPEALGYDVLFTSWLEKLPAVLRKQGGETLRKAFDQYVGSGLAIMRQHLTQPFSVKPNALVQSLLNILDGFIEEVQAGEMSATSGDNAQMTELSAIIEPLFLFSLVWSIGATTDYGGRCVFDRWLRAEMESHSASSLFPPQATVYDFTFDKESKKWTPWATAIGPYIPDSRLSFSEIIVPTPDVVRYSFLLNLLMRNGKHTLMTGPTGTGKTINIVKNLQSLPEKYVPLCFTFSAQTQANQVQDLIDSKTEKRKKGVFGPSLGKTMVLFIDDINMPHKEKYGAQPPIELLRQLLNNGGWYDRGSLEFKSIVDYVLVGACGPPGGGRNPISSRFVRYFNLISYTELEEPTMKMIFQTILSNFLQSFETQLQSLADAVTDSTVRIFQTIRKELRPTPAKCHYVYNVRDLSKVFQGLLMFSNKRVSAADELARAWIHESRRVFADRLVNGEDRKWFDQLLRLQLRTYWRLEWTDVMPSERLICGDFMFPGADPKVYEEIKELDNLVPTLEDYLSEYNAESKQPLKLVLFLDAVEHVARISRVLRQPQGNALLLGIGGSGRQSLTKLAGYVADYKLFQVEISKGYTPEDWRGKLRECLMMAGLQDKPVIFLFNDTQLVFESMLEDLNSILNSGDIPNLYSEEDISSIVNVCKADCLKRSLPPTKLNAFSQYLVRVRRNIHIVLCMSPVGEAFRNRLRMFPSIVNCCTIDWFSEWPQEALKSVAFKYMESSNLPMSELLASAVDFFTFAHQSVANASSAYYQKARRYNYVTPTSYLEFLATYKQVFESKRLELESRKVRLQTGLEKLVSAADQVAILESQLRELEPQLIATQAEVDQMMKQIEKDKEAASATKKLVEAEESEAAIKANKTKLIADDAQRDLDEALPALDQAVACLNRLKKSDLEEVRSLGRPPAGVKLTMEAACIMFQVKPVKVNDPDRPGVKVSDYWQAAQKNLLNNPTKLLQDLLAFDKDHIPDKVIDEVSSYVDLKEFTPSEIEKASKACTAICMWVLAMFKYHNVARAVEPKRAQLAEAQKSLDFTMLTLREAQEKLKLVMEKIKDLEENFEKSRAKKEQLSREVAECRIRLDRSQQLIGGLSDEKSRWSESIAALKSAIGNLSGDALVASATIAYLGPFTPDFRRDLVTLWQGKVAELTIPHTLGADLRKTLAEPVKVRAWTLSGLPADSHSVENGIILSRARRWPLFIDPQGQAGRFVKNMGRDQSYCQNGLDVIKLTDKNYLRVLETAVRFGKWVVLENVGTALDAALEPLLLQQKFKQSGTEMIVIGDSKIPYNDSFRFFITTKLPNPHFPPEVCVKVSVLNFCITPRGLEDQLLSVVVVQEMPEMEEKKNTLVATNAKMRQELQEIEEKILNLLSHSKGNLLDDVVLISTLAESKATTAEIKKKVQEAEEMERNIDEKREIYRPAAARGSVLYFCITDLATVDPMYQYSLQWYTQLFVHSIRSYERSADVSTRIKNLNEFFTYHLYKNICRSIFEKDKMLFSFLMLVRIKEADNLVDAAEFKFLISGKPTAPVDTGRSNPAADWLSERSWVEIQTLEALPSFQGFVTDFVGDLDMWKAFFDHREPDQFPLPAKYNDRLTALRRLCLLRCLRVDKVLNSIQDYIIQGLGKKFVEPPPFDLNGCYADSSTTTPLIFVLSPGSDPTKEFYKFAAMMKMDRKVFGLSLGQGQGRLAASMIEDATRSGNWVYLQNCHLYSSWMAELERIVDGLILQEGIHQDFRLWLTSMPSSNFPVAILQNAIKITNEAPKGLRSNLKNAYFKLDDEKLNRTTKPFEYKKLLFGLCLFHAVVQERRKYGGLGWNIPYEFNESDLAISRDQLELYLDTYTEVPYKVLNFLTSYINYGGRVTDEKDLRTIDVILKQFYCPKIMEDGYMFCSSPDYVSVKVDSAHPFKSYMNYIEGLPINAEPEVFGLHSNANIAAAQDEAFRTFDIIVSLQSAVVEGGSTSRETLITQLAADIERRLPPLLPVEEISQAYPVNYHESMNTVLLQECVRYNKLLAIMQSSLPELQRALKGLVVMSSELEDMTSSLARNQVPELWTKQAYPSLKSLGPWVDDLILRVTFINDWVQNGIPAVFWISGFFFPQAFLTGSLQNYARKHRYPIDSVSFSFVMKSEPWRSIDVKPEDGVLIRGLYLEGGRWDVAAQDLRDPLPKQLHSELCVVHLLPVQNRIEPNGGIYRCPVYKTLARRGTLSTTGHSTNFVTWIEIPSSKPDIINCFGKTDQDYWIKAGVAAFCALKY